jgi:hypothetical protein
VLFVIDVFGIEGRVIKQNFDAVRSDFFQAVGRPMIKQVAETAGASLVVSGLFIGQQQAGVLGAALGRGQAPATSDLNSSIKASLTSPPFSLAKAFCKDPRWSMAAAAMTPRSVDTLLRPASFPGASFIGFLLGGS